MFFYFVFFALCIYLSSFICHLMSVQRLRCTASFVHFHIENFKQQLNRHTTARTILINWAKPTIVFYDTLFWLLTCIVERTTEQNKSTHTGIDLCICVFDTLRWWHIHACNTKNRFSFIGRNTFFVSLNHIRKLKKLKRKFSHLFLIRDIFLILKRLFFYIHFLLFHKRTDFSKCMPL